MSNGNPVSVNILKDLRILFMREGFRPSLVGLNAIRVEAGFEDRPDSWLITVGEDGWRLQHETGDKQDLTFPTEETAMGYLWHRLLQPLLPS